MDKERLKRLLARFDLEEMNRKFLAQKKDEVSPKINKKAKRDLVKDRERSERVKNFEAFGEALRDLRDEIAGKKFKDFEEYKNSFIEDKFKAFMEGKINVDRLLELKL